MELPESKSTTYIEDFLPKDKWENLWGEGEKDQRDISKFISAFTSVTALHETRSLFAILSQFHFHSLSSEANIIKDSFNEYCRKWKEETVGVASPTKKTQNLNYLRIITLKEAAIPLILAELEREPDDWFLLLKVLTGANPVQPKDAGSFKCVTEAWLRWGRENKYL